MKKIVLILGALATLLVAGVTVLCWWKIGEAEKQVNTMKTEKARENRWPKKSEEGADKETPLEVQQ